MKIYIEETRKNCVSFCINYFSMKDVFCIFAENKQIWDLVAVKSILKKSLLIVNINDFV